MQCWSGFTYIWRHKATRGASQNSLPVMIGKRGFAIGRSGRTVDCATRARLRWPYQRAEALRKEEDPGYRGPRSARTDKELQQD